MDLNRSDFARLRRTFAQIVPQADVAAERFYTRLFERSPEARGLFSTDMEALGEKFMMMMAVLLDGLGDERRFARACRAQGVSHAGFGVRNELYAPAAEALVDAFASTVPGWGDEDGRVWKVFLSQIAQWMQEGACEGGE